MGAPREIRKHLLIQLWLTMLLNHSFPARSQHIEVLLQIITFFRSLNHLSKSPHEDETHLGFREANMMQAITYS